MLFTVMTLYLSSAESACRLRGSVCHLELLMVLRRISVLDYTDFIRIVANKY